VCDDLRAGFTARPRRQVFSDWLRIRRATVCTRPSVTVERNASFNTVSGRDAGGAVEEDVLPRDS